MRGSRSRRVLVAGGAGFIGSNLCARLLSQNVRVDCIDNLSTGNLEQIAPLQGRPGFAFIQGDIVDAALVSGLADRQYHEIYDLACPTGVPNIALLGEEMMLASSAGTLNLIRLAARCGSRFLFASTAEVYGDPEVFPQREDYTGNVDPAGPRSPYEEGKRFGEALTAFHARERNLDARIVRIFNCYGPRMSPRDQRVIPRMLERIRRGEPVRIYGDGQQTRTFMHVDDLLAGIDLVMRKGTAGEIYNIGSSRETTIIELFRMASVLAGTCAPPVFEAHFTQDHARRRPDTTKLAELGWTQQVSLEEGLARCYRAVMDGEPIKPGSTVAYGGASDRQQLPAAS